MQEEFENIRFFTFKNELYAYTMTHIRLTWGAVDSISKGFMCFLESKEDDEGRIYTAYEEPIPTQPFYINQ